MTPTDLYSMACRASDKQTGQLRLIEFGLTEWSNGVAFLRWSDVYWPAPILHNCCANGIGEWRRALTILLCERPIPVRCFWSTWPINKHLWIAFINQNYCGYVRICTSSPPPPLMLINEGRRGFTGSCMRMVPVINYSVRAWYKYARKLIIV